MIKINPVNISAIELMHLRHIKPSTIKYLKFYKDLFERLGNKRFVDFSNNTPSCIYGIHHETLNTMMQPFLKSIYRKKGKKKINNNHIKTLLSTRNSSIILNQNHLNYYRGLLQFILEIEKEIDQILIGKPLILSRIKNKIIYKNNKTKHFILVQLLRYEHFTDNGFEIITNNLKSSWGSYTLTSALGVNVCPYCNKNWINTVGSQNSKVTNPQLDHYFSKSDFPILRLSLYNLIPSCETCNVRLKGNEEFIYSENLHPYEAGYSRNAKFYSISLDTASSLGRSNNFTIGIKYSDFIASSLKKQIKNNHELFQIDSIYKYHGDIISELYLKRHLYSKDYLNILKNNISFHNEVSLNEFYRIAFANYLDEKDFNKRPFSKLTKDIIEQLEFI